MPTSRLLWGTGFENEVVFDYPIFNVVTDREPREGSTRITGPSGVTDTWITGWDYILDCEARFIPDDESNGTTPISGSRSWQDFLSYAREGGELRFVPDVTFPDFWLPETYLVEPWRGFGSLTSNIKRQVALRLKNTGGYDFHLALRGLMLEYKAGGVTDYWTHTRTSTATYRGKDTIGALANTGVLRDRHFEGSVHTTLLEAARTQLVTDPENFGNWTSTGTPVLTSGQADPFGGSDAYLIEDNDGGAEEYKGQNVTFTGNAVKALAVFIKPNTASIEQRVILRDTTAGTNRLEMRITWSGGVPSVVQTTGTQLRTPMAYTNGWYLFWFQTTSVTAANTNQFQLKPAAASTAQTGSAYFFGANAWDAAFPSSYQGTGAASRALDVFQYVVAGPPQAMWFYVKFVERGTIGSAANTKIWHMGSDSANPHWRVQTSGTFYQVIHQQDSGSVAATLGAAPSIGDTVELLASLASTGAVSIRQSINGASETSAGPSSALALPAAWFNQNLWINSHSATSGHGYIGIAAIKNGAGNAVSTIAQARLV